MAHKMRKAKQEAQEVQAHTDTVAVKALEFLKRLNLDWVISRPLEEGDIAILQAQVSTAENGSEWASWWMTYNKADGTPVPGISWGVSAPMTGGFIILRLVESGQVKAILKVWKSGKGTLTGAEPVVKALLNRPDLPAWTDQDTASLL